MALIVGGLLLSGSVLLGWYGVTLTQQNDELLRRSDRQADAQAEVRNDLERQQSDFESQQAELEGQQEQLESGQDRLASEQNSLSKQQRELEEKAELNAPIDVADISSRAQPSVVVVECGYALGSGFVMDGVTLPEGFGSIVITNNHVIEQCAQTGEPVLVRQGDRYFTPTLWTLDVDNDLASIVLTEQLPGLRMGDSPVIGDEVVALGAPEGLEGSATRGIVSRVEENYIQTDTALNHGNSGGPLLDRSGEFVGVVFAGFPDPDAEGLNFAIRGRVLYATLLTRS